MATQITRIEFRALEVRPYRGRADALLPVASFKREATAKEPFPAAHDLLEVLLELLSEKEGEGPDIHTPELLIGQGEDPAVAENRQRRGRSAIEIRQVERLTDRRLRVDFEWSVSTPDRILNLESQQEFRPDADDTGMQATTAVITVPDGGNHAYVGIEHRVGVVSVFEPALQRWFRDHADMEDFRLHMAGHVPDKFWEAFLDQGTVLQLDFAKATVPADLTDYVEAGEVANARRAGTVRTVVKPEPGLYAAAKRFVSDQLAGIAHSAGSLTWEGITYESVKAKVRRGGVVRTLELGPEIDARNAPAFPVEVEVTADQRRDADDLSRKIAALMDDVLDNP